MAEEQKKINYGLIITLMITILGWGATFGVCQNKIENNARAIERLEQYKAAMDSNTQQIYTQLAGLNAKMDLILDGRIVTAK